MATTTKTLTPTNQTVTLPDMTERPNASVLVDGIGKEADAINALSEHMIKAKAFTATTNIGGGFAIISLSEIPNLTLYKMISVISTTQDIILESIGNGYVIARDSVTNNYLPNTNVTGIICYMDNEIT